jgi:hypothetical protein
VTAAMLAAARVFTTPTDYQARSVRWFPYDRVRVVNVVS